MRPLELIRAVAKAVMPRYFSVVAVLAALFAILSALYAILQESRNETPKAIQCAMHVDSTFS